MNKKISLLFLPFVLLMLTISGCNDQVEENDTMDQTDQIDSAEEIDLLEDNPEETVDEIDDPTLDELDNINLSDW